MQTSSPSESVIERAAQAIRAESFESLEFESDAIWSRHCAHQRRRRRRRTVLAAALAGATLLGVGAVGFAGPDNVWGAVRSILAQFSFESVANDGRPHEQEVVVESIESTALGSFLQRSSSGRGIRTGLLVDPDTRIEISETETEYIYVAVGSDGAEVGRIAVSVDGSTITASGQTFILMGEADHERPDVTGDGAVDHEDLRRVMAAIGDTTPADEDVNRDGVVDASDVLEIVREMGH